MKKAGWQDLADTHSADKQGCRLQPLVPAALFPVDALEIRQSDRAEAFSRQQVTALGLKLETVRVGIPQIDDGKVRAYVELHIEQGPILIKGRNSRVRSLQAFGEASAIGTHTS